jgi:hypothetical protein
MNVGRIRGLAVLIASGGLLFGGGCASIVRDSLLQFGLTALISQFLGLSA